MSHQGILALNSGIRQYCYFLTVEFLPFLAIERLQQGGDNCQRKAGRWQELPLYSGQLTWYSGMILMGSTRLIKA